MSSEHSNLAGGINHINRALGITQQDDDAVLEIDFTRSLARSLSFLLSTSQDFFLSMKRLNQ